MKRIQISKVKPTNSAPRLPDTRTPSGRVLPF
jgi:hypothetical protein